MLQILNADDASFGGDAPDGIQGPMAERKASCNGGGEQQWAKDEIGISDRPKYVEVLVGFSSDGEPYPAPLEHYDMIQRADNMAIPVDDRIARIDAWLIRPADIVQIGTG